MKKSNFVGAIWLMGYENGKKCAEIDTSTLSNHTLKVILDHWKSINRTWLYDLRF